MSIEDLKREPFVEYTVGMLCIKKYSVVDLTPEGAIDYVRNRVAKDNTIVPIHFTVVDEKEFE